VLCLGGWIIGPLIADEILTTFLNARFLSSDPDFARRVHKLEEMDKR
jgi:ribose 5-phosphate isomerase B